MIQHPAIIALSGASLISAALTGAAAVYGVRIVRCWDLASGSEQQLVLERKTYLISVIMAYTLAFQILALFLFIHTADSIHTLFTGAMCAAGSLAANGSGYPLLLLKTGNCIVAGCWLFLNRLDNTGYDYPLIRPKYRLLALIALLMVGETLLQLRYFTGLQADVITSCCGSLFGSSRENLGSELAALPARPMMAAFALAGLLHLGSGLFALRRNRGWIAFALLSLGFFLTAVAALISFISLYFYELPTHHCPFCILQNEYGSIGYLLYGCLLGGVISGMGSGLAALAAGKESLRKSLPGMQRKAALAALVLNGVFTGIALARIVTTSFRL